MTKRKITPHKGGRTARLEVRIAPEAKKRLSQLHTAQNISAADWIEAQIERETQRMSEFINYIDAILNMWGHNGTVFVAFNRGGDEIFFYDTVAGEYRLSGDTIEAKEAIALYSTIIDADAGKWDALIGEEESRLNDYLGGDGFNINEYVGNDKSKLLPPEGGSVDGE